MPVIKLTMKRSHAANWGPFISGFTSGKGGIAPGKNGFYRGLLPALLVVFAPALEAFVLLAVELVDAEAAPVKSTSNYLSTLLRYQRRLIFSSLAMGGTG